MIEFRIPWPPSLNTYYVCVHKRKVLSKKGREYAALVKKLAVENRFDVGIDCEVFVEIKLAPPKNGIWDGDNYTKAIFDALTKAGVWTDDSLVWKYSVEKIDKYAIGEVYISIMRKEDVI